MLLLKFSLLFLSLSVYSFSGNECFGDAFQVEVKHPSFPMGLLSKTLSIEKKDCEIKVSHNEMKYRNRAWTIDVCREPIHLKINSSDIEVVRKVSDCKNNSDKFCKEFQILKRIMQDDGLIFAEGDKTNLESSHGKVFCSYLLLNEYLEQSIVMTKGFDYNYLGTQKKTAEEIGANPVQIDPNSGKADF